MIFSTLNGRDDFSAYPRGLREALRYLRETDVMALPLGRQTLDGDRLFLNVMDMTTRPYEGSYPEVHRRYADLMYWPEGGERIGVAPFLGTEPVRLSRPEDDIALLEAVERETILTVGPGCFCVFFPWDAHRPALMLGDAPATSRKCVVKISMERMGER